MKKILYIVVVLMVNRSVFAQQEKAPLWEGNNLYKKKDFQKSLEAYNKALALAPANPLANYNMGNTQFRLNKFDEAEKMYDNTITNATGKPEREKAYYNKGVALTRQKKLDESIAAYKEALKLDTKDQEARENLQKALLEKKEEDKKNKQNDDNKKDNKEDKDKKDQKNNKKDEQEKPKDKQEKQSKLSKQQVEQLLKALEQKEKDVQKKIQENQKKEEDEKNRSATQPAKDW